MDQQYSNVCFNINIKYHINYDNNINADFNDKASTIVSGKKMLIVTVNDDTSKIDNLLLKLQTKAKNNIT